MNKRIIPIAIIVAIAALVTVSVISRNKKKYIEVETFDVVLQDFSKEVSANGEIRSIQESKAVSKVSGNIASIKVKVGDRVKSGQVLVTIEKKDLDSQMRNAAASVENTKVSVRRELMSLRNGYVQSLSSLEKAQRDYERTVELQKIGSASEEELRLKKDALASIQQNFISAREQLNLREGRALSDPRENDAPEDSAIVASSAEVRQAEAQLRSINETIENYAIKALTDGVVTQLNVSEGGVVGMGTLVAAIYDDKNLEIITNIDEVDLSYLKIGQSVKIESDSFIGEKIEGVVDTIAPIIMRVGDSRVCSITIKIRKDEKKLARIGASCSVFIVVENKTQVPAIPVEAYFLKDGKSLVALLTEGEEKNTFTVKLQEIKTGILGVETVEVVSGLEAGQKIVSKKASVLNDDDTVKLKIEKKNSKKPKEGDSETKEEEPSK